MFLEMVELSLFYNNNILKTYIYNHGHNILRLFDASPNFIFTTSEMKRDY